MKITYIPEVSARRFDERTGEAIQPKVKHLMKVQWGALDYQFEYASFGEFPGVEKLCKRIESLSDDILTSELISEQR